jgi:outer membrane protein assembly factor BamB
VARLEVDHPVTAVEVDAGGSVLYVALKSGTLLGVAVDTAEPQWRQELSINGQPTVELSLASAEPGRLLIGTVDGRVLGCR